MLTFSVNRDVNMTLRSTSIAEQIIKTSAGGLKASNHNYGRLWFSEVFFKAVEGRLGRGNSEINVDAYGYKCEMHQSRLQANREIAILTDSELETGLRGVSESVATYVEYNIDAIIESSEVATIVRDFVQMHEYLLVEEGVNLWRIFTLARQANERVVETLRNLIVKYDRLEDIVKSALTNTGCLTILEGELSC